MKNTTIDKWIFIVFLIGVIVAILIIFQPCNKPVKHQDQVAAVKKGYDSLKVVIKENETREKKWKDSISNLNDKIVFLELERGQTEIEFNAATARANNIAKKILLARKNNDTAKYVNNCDSLSIVAAQDWIGASRAYTNTIDSLIEAFKKRDSVKNDVLAQRETLNSQLRIQLDESMKTLYQVNDDYKLNNRKLTRAKGLQRLEAVVILVLGSTLLLKK